MSESTPAGPHPDLPRRGGVVVRAWAPWCGSCRAMRPLVEEVATDSGTPVYELQVDAEPGLVAELGIGSVPTLIALRDGAEVARLVGAQPRHAIGTLFDAAAGSDHVAVRSATPTSLLAIRGGAGVVLGVAGWVLDTLVLAGVGAGLAAWASSGLLARATNRPP